MKRRRSWLRAGVVNGVTLTMSMLAIATAADAQHVTLPSAAPQIATDARVTGSAPPSPLTERERLLLERLEELERRVNELEARVRPPVSPVPDGVEPVPALGEAAAPSPVREQAANPSETGGVKLVPHAVLVGSAAYNTYGLIPGSIAFYGVPRVPGITGRQFSISAGNTLVGTDILLPQIGGWDIGGKFYFNLRGPTPLTDDNVFAPFFANVYIEARRGRHRILAGQAQDVISPLSPRSLNLYPGNFLPGDLGAARPQVRYDYGWSAGDKTAITLQSALATAVQTFQISDEVLGFGTDVPDLQLRVGVGRGEADPRSGKRPLELGVSGHVGQRRTVRVSALFEDDFTMWSGNIDVAARLGQRTSLSGEAFVGEILGDYKGGILHTFNAIRGVGVRAAGGWAQLQYQLTSKMSVAGGYALDDTFNEDLSTGFRSRNDTVYGNVFYAFSPRLHVGLDVGRWHTRWVGLPSGRVTRIEPAIIYVF
jgi:hypothetical protein